MTKHVTVVIPVYGDWPTLGGCIKSLSKHLSAKHKVILVNDCGPEVEQIENNIKHAIAGLSNFEYHRNPQNLGFLRTCNRGVELDNTDNDILLLNSDTEVTGGFLDEMLDVLYSHPRHGCVCPRSSNATIATVPIVPKDPIQERDHSHAYQVYKDIKNLLPTYSVSPVSMGYCILIKRDLIKQFGLFDEVYGPGYAEENDFCLRINAHGYSSLIANHAFVYHFESRSFTSKRRLELVAKNEKILLSRYPFYHQWVERYINRQIHPVDYFADVIAGKPKSRKVLVWFQKSPETAASVKEFNNFLKVAGISSSQFAVVGDEFAESWGFKYDNGRTVDPYGLNELFHIGLVVGIPKSIEQLAVLNRRCLSLLAFSDDDQLLRNGAELIANQQSLSANADSLKYFDQITLTEDAKANLLALFNGDDEIEKVLNKKMSDIFMPDVNLLVKRWRYFNSVQNYIPNTGQNFNLKRLVPRPIKKAIKKGLGR